MNTNTQTPEVTTVKKETVYVDLSGKVTGKKLKSNIQRKETNEAKKAAVKDAKDNERTLSFQVKRLRNHAADYVNLLSKETGKQITVEMIAALKYGDFLPYLTEREEQSNLLNGWTFNRYLSVIARAFRNEQKGQVKESVLSEIE